MRRIIAFTLILIITYLFSFNAYSVKCDGYDEGYEWSSASTVSLINGNSNCNVNLGAARFLIENSENAVYVCLILNDKNLEQGNNKAGFIFCIGNSDYVTLTTDGIEESYDNNKYTFSGAMTINENNGAFAELRVGFKEGVPAKISGKVRFIDYSGEPSDYCNIELVNTEYSEPTAATVIPSTTEKDTPYKETEKESKTARIKTTKAKTTKKKTTKKATTKKATTRKRSNNDGSIDIEFPDINISLPKVQKTKAVTDPVSLTQKPDNAVDNRNVTIYYVEKEVIISNVYITSADTTQPIEQTVTVIVAQQTADTQNFNESMRKGLNYKTLIGALCSAVFVAFLIWSVKDTKKKAGFSPEANDNNTTENKEVKEKEESETENNE